MKINIFFAIVCVFLFSLMEERHIFAEGFLRNTSVKTAIGYIAIEDIGVNDLVTCCDDGWVAVERSVTAVHKKQVTQYVKIIVGDQLICAAVDQKFYLPLQHKWVEAQKIIPGDLMLSNGSDVVQVSNVVYVQSDEYFYTISVDDYHNFCVSSLNISVHNFFPPLAVGLTWGFGAGAIEFTGATIGIAGAVLRFMVSHKSKEKIKCNIVPNGESYGNHGMPPEDPDEKKRKKNDMSKVEFFKQDIIQKNYEHYRDGIYRKKNGAYGIENAEYLEWDYLHNDVEAYSVRKKHLGSIDPQKCKLYKKSDPTRSVGI